MTSSRRAGKALTRKALTIKQLKTLMTLVMGTHETEHGLA